MRRRVRNKERGASLVEFALVVPLLTLFLFGIVQFGIAYDKKQSINSAAREGARAAAIPSNDFAAIETATSSAFQGIDGDDEITVRVENRHPLPVFQYDGQRTGGSGAVVDPDGGAGDTGPPCADPVLADADLAGSVVVTATVEHTLTIPFFGAPTVTLTGRGEFRCERSS